MLATYVLPVQTPFTLDELAKSLQDGFEIVIGTKPRDEQLAVLFAQCRLEGGNGLHVWNGDIANIKRADSDVGNFTCIVLNEVEKKPGDAKPRLYWYDPRGELVGGPGSAIKPGTEHTVPDGHPQTRMAALPSQVEAGRFYVDFLANRKRYAGAWQYGVLAGDPAACSQLLSAEGYYTAPVDVYTKTFVALFNSSLARIRGLPHEEINQPSRNDWHAEAVLAAASYDINQAMLDDKNEALREEDT